MPEQDERDLVIPDDDPEIPEDDTAEPADANIEHGAPPEEIERLIAGGA